MPRANWPLSPQFSIRTMLVATTLVAICLVAWRERTRYLREHLFVQVVDQVTGNLLPRFQYQTSVITAESVEEESWSDWRDHTDQSALTLKVPQFCRLEFRARALNVGGGYSPQEKSILVLPHLSHSATLRLDEGTSFQSFLIDCTSGEPIRGARIVPAYIDLSNSSGFFERQPYFDDEFETISDSNGKFTVRNLRSAFVIAPKGYQCRVVHIEHPEEDLERLRNDGIQLEPAVPILGRVTCGKTGKPISDCEVVYDNKLFREDSKEIGTPLASKERMDLHLVTKTDPDGCFELLADSDLENCRVWFSKKGWQPESVELSDCDNDITLEPWPYELAGKVVDESGEPVQDFEIDSYSGWVDVETYRFQDENGLFRIGGDSPSFHFSVHAKNKGVFSNLDLSVWDEEQPIELVVLPTGFEVKGTIIETGNLARIGPSQVQMELRRLPAHSDSYFDTTSNSRFAIVANSAVGPDGSFQFNHVSNGIYKLVTSYCGLVVNTRPVVVDEKNVLIAPIELPRLGRIRGKVRKEDGSDAPFHRTFITDQQGNTQKWFHTNHLGEFELKNVPCGRYGIGPQPKQRYFNICGLGGRGWDIDGTILIEPKQTTDFSYDRFPLFEFQGLSPSAFLFADVRRSQHFSAIDYDTDRTIEIDNAMDSLRGNTNPVRVATQKQPSDKEAFIAILTQEGCQQELALEYRANRDRLANKILFLRRQLKLSCSDTAFPIQKTKPEVEIITPNDDPFGEGASTKDFEPKSELYVGKTTVFLLGQNRVMSQIYATGFQEVFPFHIHDTEPDAAIIHNTLFGWSRINLKRPLGNESEAHALTLTKGAEIHGKLNLVDLPLMPAAVRLLAENGASLTCQVKENNKFDFKMIWPGKWRLQLLGNDPYLEERILVEKELVIEGIDSHELELGVYSRENAAH